VDATHLIINQLRSRAQYAERPHRLSISPAAIRCLRQHRLVAERAGVRFRSDGVTVEGVEFLIERSRKRFTPYDATRAVASARAIVPYLPLGAPRIE
jgi:hypothetical protein